MQFQPQLPFDYKDKKVWIIVALLVVAFWFYWHEWRPAQLIKKYCSGDYHAGFRDYEECVIFSTGRMNGTK